MFSLSVTLSVLVFVLGVHGYVNRPSVPPSRIVSRGARTLLAVDNRVEGSGGSVSLLETLKEKEKKLGSAADASTLRVVDCTLWDMSEIMRLSLEEFSDRCRTEKDKEELKAEIRSLFLPKMVLNPFMGHKIIGLKKPNSDELVGFVDLSLQTQSLDALKPLPYLLRVGKYGANGLRPYLCNLLVAPEYRRRGLGKKLVNECIEASKEWGHSELFLHVQESTPAPLNLYLKMGFVRSFPREQYASLLRKKFPNTNQMRTTIGTIAKDN